MQSEDHSLSRHGRALAYFAVAAGVVFLWTFDIRNYPQVTFDEGGWNMGAKSLIEYGHLLAVGRPIMLVSLSYQAVATAFFSIFGTGLIQARMISGTAGLLTCLALYHAARNHDWPTRFLSVVFLASMVLFLQFSRLAVIEPFATAMLTASACVLLRGTRRSGIWAGLLFGAALLAKPTNLFFAGPLLAWGVTVTYWNSKHESNETFGALHRSLWCLVTGITIGAATHLALFAIYQDAYLGAWTQEMNLPSGYEGFRIGRFGLNFAAMARTSWWFFMHTFPAVLFVPFGVYATIRNRDKTGLLMGLWFLGGLGFLFTQVYQFTRYLLNLGPPLAFFTATGYIMILRFARARFPNLGVLKTHLAWIPAAGVVLFSLALFGYSWHHNRSEDYSRFMTWVKQTIETVKNHRLAGANYDVLGYPGKILTFHAVGAPALMNNWGITPEIADDHNIAYLAYSSNVPFDDPFVAQKCRLLRQQGNLTLWQVKEQGAPREMQKIEAEQ